MPRPIHPQMETMKSSSVSVDFHRYQLIKKKKIDIVEPKNDLLVGAVLKAYSSVYDTYVFEQNKSLLWLIGYDIDD